MAEYLTELEMLSIIGVHAPAVIVAGNLFPSNDFVQCVLLLGAQYLGIVFHQYVWILYGVLMTVILVVPKGKTTAADPCPAIIDRARFIVISCVLITIFASDFGFYRRQSNKLGKSMDYGLNLMDIGVGMFVLNAGFFSAKMTFRRKIRGMLVAGFFGSVRLLCRLTFEKSASDREFGSELNFFFILAILNGFSLWIHTKYDFVVGILMCLLHDVLLYRFGLDKFIYEAERTNFITSNKEGLAFILPELGMFLVSAGIAKVVFDKSQPRSKLLVYFLVCTGVFLFGRMYALPNRRLHNLSFCFVQFLCLFLVGVVTYVESLFGAVATSRIQAWAARHLLFLLIWGNVLVAVNKHVFAFRKMDSVGHLLTAVYLLMTIWAPATLSRKYSEKGGNSALRAKSMQ